MLHYIVWVWGSLGFGTSGVCTGLGVQGFRACCPDFNRLKRRQLKLSVNPNKSQAQAPEAQPAPLNPKHGTPRGLVCSPLHGAALRGDATVLEALLAAGGRKYISIYIYITSYIIIYTYIHSSTSSDRIYSDTAEKCL